MIMIAGAGISMSHRVLIIFGGGFGDASLACSALGMSHHFKRVKDATVTNLSTLDMSSFLQNGPMVYGRKEGIGGRTVVFSKLLLNHRDAQYHVVPGGRMKAEILSWMDNVRQQDPPEILTIVSCCHGYSASDPSGTIPIGTMAFGYNQDASELSPDELLISINTLDLSIRINLVVLGCYSGAWLDRSLVFQPLGTCSFTQPAAQMRLQAL